MILCARRTDAPAVDERRDLSCATDLAPQSDEDAVATRLVCRAVFLLEESLDVPFQRPHSGSGSFHQPAVDEFVHQRTASQLGPPLKARRGCGRAGLLGQFDGHAMTFPHFALRETADKVSEGKHALVADGDEPMAMGRWLLSGDESECLGSRHRGSEKRTNLSGLAPVRPRSIAQETSDR